MAVPFVRADGTLLSWSPRDVQGLTEESFNQAKQLRPDQIGEKNHNVRSWADGSPRLTAYEYQGILNSPCFLKGEPGNRINCNSCHTMHGGDVKGQITDEMRTNVACTQCHTELRDEHPLKTFVFSILHRSDN